MTLTCKVSGSGNGLAVRALSRGWWIKPPSLNARKVTGVPALCRSFQVRARPALTVLNLKYRVRLGKEKVKKKLIIMAQWGADSFLGVVPESFR